MQKNLVLGVDIGGTKVAAGLVNAAGELLYSVRLPMVTSGSASEGMDCVHYAIGAVLDGNPGVNVQAIGVASPGPLDPHTGVIINSPNLPCWPNFALLPEIERIYLIPTKVDNDANAAGLAEALWGAGKDYETVLYATIGTGIGTAMILDRQIYYGRTGAAGEGGHMTIDFRGPARCGCGKRGCTEGLAAGPAIAARARGRLVANSDDASLLKWADGDANKITAETVVRAWHENDSLAADIMRETADILAVWLGNMIDLLEPDVIVIGGGVGAAIQKLFPYIQKQAATWSINSRAGEIPLVAAKYGADAGIVGSAALWMCDQQALESSQSVNSVELYSIKRDASKLHDRGKGHFQHRSAEKAGPLGHGSKIHPAK
jgi:glucokinase